MVSVTPSRPARPVFAADQVIPPSTDFRTPPSIVPMKTVPVPRGSTAMAWTAAGLEPMLIHAPPFCCANSTSGERNMPIVVIFLLARFLFPAGFHGTPTGFHRTPIVTSLLGRPMWVRRTGTAGPGATPAGTRTLIWFSPPYPGVFPNHNTSAIVPPIDTWGGI